MSSKAELKERLKFKINSSKLSRLPKDVKEQKIDEIKTKLHEMMKPPT